MTMKKYRKAYLKAGGLTPNAAVSNGTAMAAAVANPLIDAIDQGNKYGRQTGLSSGLKQGASMAAAGAALGPAGAIAGGALGLGMGLVGSIGAKRQEMAMDRTAADEQQQNSVKMGMAKVYNDPSLMYGNKNAQMFAMGGPMEDDPAKATKPMTPQEREFWNRYVSHLESQGLKGSKELDKKDTNLSRTKFDEFAKGSYAYDDLVPRVQSEAMSYRSKAIDMIKAGKAQYTDYDKDKNFEKFMPGLSKVDGWAGSSTTNFQFPKEAVLEASTGQPMKQGNSVYASMPKKAMGGQLSESYEQSKQLKPLNNQAVEVQGPSHEQGGVQIPGAEVEGGETISNGFVFSDALGFSKLHKPIAKAIGKLEDKPATPIRVRTMKALKGQEQQLATAQESFKQHLGIQ